MLWPRKYRQKAILRDVTYADLQAGPTCGREALTESDQLLLMLRFASAITPVPGLLSFDERSDKLATLAVESFGRLERTGSDLADQMTDTRVGGTDGSSLARKGVCEECLFKVISVATQVAISRRLHECGTS